MSARWVCKPAPEGKDKETSLEEMRAELAAVIGSDNILSMETRGKINAFEITAEGWEILTQGFVGPQGFEACKSA